MQRALAIMLLALFGLLPVAPLVSTQSDTKLPTCCRREGKHHCGMANEEKPSGAALREKCPYFGGASTAPLARASKILSPSHSCFTYLLSYAAVLRQIEARERISFHCSRLKRGPPAFPSLTDC